VVGIRPGEKLHEELFNVDEEVRPTRYGKIMRATRPPLDPLELAAGLQELASRATSGNPDGVAEALWATLGLGRTTPADGEVPGSSAPRPTIPETSEP
jgi:FlaA1/EpsC-like NDP-sugar epimerase